MATAPDPASSSTTQSSVDLMEYLLLSGVILVILVGVAVVVDTSTIWARLTNPAPEAGPVAVVPLKGIGTFTVIGVAIRAAGRLFGGNAMPFRRWELATFAGALVGGYGVAQVLVSTAKAGSWMWTPSPLEVTLATLGAVQVVTLAVLMARGLGRLLRRT